VAIDDGRLELSARQPSSAAGRGARETIAGGASFVTFVRQGGALGLSSPASYVRIPWTPRMAEIHWTLSTRLQVRL